MKSRQSLNSHRIIRSMLTFFKIIGLATFSVRNVVSRKHSKIAFVFVSSKLGSYYNWILALVMFGSNFVAIPQTLYAEYPNKTAMTTGIEIFLSALGNVTVNAILVSCCVNQTNLVRMGNHLIDIEWELRRLRHQAKRGSVSSAIIVACLLNGCLWLSVCYTNVLAFQSSPSEWLTSLVPMFVVCWFIVQYFTVVSLVNAAFVDVNRALRDVYWSVNFQPESLREARPVLLSSSSMQYILQLRNLHERLCGVSVEISQFYSIPILLAITFSFLWLIYMFYYLLMLLIVEQTSSDYWPIGNTIFIIVYLMHPLLLLSNKITDTAGEIRRTGRAVHLLLNSPVDEILMTELKQFSIQLLHGRVQFTANGYFILDNTFVNSMAGAVSTYLVILIQFELQSISPTDCSCNCSVNYHLNHLND